MWILRKAVAIKEKNIRRINETSTESDQASRNWEPDTDKVLTCWNLKN